MRSKAVVLLLCIVLALQGCGPVQERGMNRNGSSDQAASDLTVEELVETDSLQSLQSLIYSQTVANVNDEYFVENVEIRYVSEEYLEELSYNSQTNVYFGFSLAELAAIYGDTSFLFAVDETGSTIVEAFEEYSPDFETVVNNFAIGGGVILVCITISAATGGVAPAVSMIFSFAAKGAVTGSLAGAAIGATAGAINAGIQEGNVDEILHSALVEGSEGFKYGAIAGAIEGGANEAIGLFGATRNGLTLTQAARIQQESGWSLNTIKTIRSETEYRVYQSAGLREATINGRRALIQDIDWSIVDEDGMTNAERVIHNLAPIDANGVPYELHHIGQRTDSPLAILTQEQHRLGSNYSALHTNEDPGVHSIISPSQWAQEKRVFWKALLDLTLEGQ